MDGASYKEVIEAMETREGEHEANPFARVAPETKNQAEQTSDEQKEEVKNQPVEEKAGEDFAAQEPVEAPTEEGAAEEPKAEDEDSVISEDDFNTILNMLKKGRNAENNQDDVTPNFPPRRY